MDTQLLQIIESIVIIGAYILLRMILFRSVDRIASKFKYQNPRVQVIKKLIISALVFVCGGILLFIWRVDQSDLVVFVTTMITILGIAFFAQWSIISNITSALIIFFNHPAKIGERITVLDKDYAVEGEIIDIGLFFVIVLANENEKIAVPNNVFTQKMVRREAPTKVNSDQ